MAENIKVDTNYLDQVPDIATLIARGRALRNKMICESCSQVLQWIKKVFTP